MKVIVLYVTDDGAEYEFEQDAIRHDAAVRKSIEAADAADRKSRKTFMFYAGLAKSAIEPGIRWPAGSYSDGEARIYVWSCVAPFETALELAILRLVNLRERGIRFGLDQDVAVDGKDTVSIGDHPKAQEFLW
jgi:hypothetical protein